MKKLFRLVLVLALLTPGLLQAAPVNGNFPMAGCGPWYMLFGNKSDDKGTQIGVAVLNNFVFPGPFLSSSMSSGTSGCLESGELRWAQSADIFAEANFDVLKKELAQGEGEYATTFAALIVQKDEQVPVLVSLMKEKYDVLFPSDSTTHTDLINNLSSVLSGRRDILS